MIPTQIISVVLVIALIFPALSEQNPVDYLPCRKCLTREECDEAPPQICPWGEGRDVCDRRVCLKGPGEACGGRYNVMGKCADSLMCATADGRCHGCFIQSMTCWPELKE